MLIGNLGDFKDFARLMIETKDIDPLYPVMRELYELMELGEEEALWATAVYLAYYNLPSGLVARNLVTRRLQGVPSVLPPLPIAVERRGHRDPVKLDRHLMSLIHVAQDSGGLGNWLSIALGSDPVINFRLLYDRVQTVWGNGRWAAFKWVELLKEVHGFNVAAPDMMLEEASGPLDGLRRFAPHGSKLCDLEHVAVMLHEMLHALGVPTTWEQLETLLCNWNSLCSAHYYVGHDIDELQGQIVAARGDLDPDTERLLYEARRRALPADYLGELNGWTGVRKDLMALYAEHGLVSRHQQSFPLWGGDGPGNAVSL